MADHRLPRTEVKYRQSVSDPRYSIPKQTHPIPPGISKPLKIASPEWKTYSNKFVLQRTSVTTHQLICRQAVPQENLPRDLFDSPKLNGPSPFVGGSQAHAQILSASTDSPPTKSPSVPVDVDDASSSDDEYSTRQTLAESFKSVSMDPGGPHFFGKSSSFLFLQKAMDIRQEYVNELVAPGVTERTILTPASFPRKRSKFWSTHPVSVRISAMKVAC